MKLICAEILTADIEAIIERLKNSNKPNPVGTIEECLAAAEIEALEIAKGLINEQATYTTS